MNVLLTGGLGFIGSHTVIELVNSDYNVIIIDNLSNSKISVLENIYKLCDKNKITFYKGDIFEDEVINYIKSFFEKKIDLLISDMSPNSTGNKKVDHLRILSLVERVVDISNLFLKEEGFIVIKIFQGGMYGDLMISLKESLKNIKNFKPRASRKESPEMYLIAQKK